MPGRRRTGQIADVSPEPDPVLEEDPLSEEQRERLREAGGRLDEILRAARVASFTAWTVAIFGGISLLLGLTSPIGAAVGAALLAVAWNEFRGRRLLRALSPEGARVLGWNQLALLVVVILYCGWSVWSVRSGPGPEVRQLQELAGLPADFVSEMATVMYAAVAAIVAIVQGLLARYHFARGPRLEAYLDETPRWIVDVQRTAS